MPRSSTITAAVLVVLAIVIAIYVARRRGEQHWESLAGTPTGVAPRCTLPGDRPTMRGVITATAGDVPAGAACWQAPVPAGSSEADIARLAELNRDAILAGCGPGPVTYAATGTYRCGPSKEGYASGVVDEAVVRAGETTPISGTAGGGLMPAGSRTLAGAARSLRELIPCGCRNAGTLVGGYIDAYLRPPGAADPPCAHMPIESEIPITPESLDWIERRLSRSCNAHGYDVRAGWFVVRAVASGLCDCAGAAPAGKREGFFCWGSENARENYVGGRKGKLTRRDRFCGACAEMFAAKPARRKPARRARFEAVALEHANLGPREQFTRCYNYGVPGACDGLASQRMARAAAIELES